MRDFEDTALENYHLKPWVWWRYINDILLVWEEALLEFITYLNSIHLSIKFTYKYSFDSIELLDVKETDTHQFLHFTSCHHFHTKRGIHFDQALRIRRICSDNVFFCRADF